MLPIQQIQKIALKGFVNKLLKGKKMSLSFGLFLSNKIISECRVVHVVDAS